MESAGHAMVTAGYVFGTPPHADTDKRYPTIRHLGSIEQLSILNSGIRLFEDVQNGLSCSWRYPVTRRSFARRTETRRTQGLKAEPECSWSLTYYGSSEKTFDLALFQARIGRPSTKVTENMFARATKQPKTRRLKEKSPSSAVCGCL